MDWNKSKNHQFKLSTLVQSLCSELLNKKVLPFLCFLAFLKQFRNKNGFNVFGRVYLCGRLFKNRFLPYRPVSIVSVRYQSCISVHYSHEIQWLIRIVYTSDRSSGRVSPGRQDAGRIRDFSRVGSIFEVITT